MNLQQTQELFWQAVRNEATPKAICACFEGDTQLSAISRMKIYSNAFFSRQLSALSKFLPKTEGLLQGEFPRLCREYVVRVPGVDAPLESFPQHFAAFLEEKGRYSEAAALARLELARNHSLLAPEEAPVLTPADMQSLSPTCGLRATRHAHVVRSTRNAFQIFGRQDKGSAELDACDGEHIWVLFFRKGFTVRHRVLEQDDIRAFEILRSGTTLSALCEFFLGFPEPSRRVHHVLSRFLKDGILLFDPTSSKLKSDVLVGETARED